MSTVGADPVRPDPGTGPADGSWSGPDEAALLRQLVAMCSHLSTLASQAAGLASIAEVLAASIGSRVVVVDEQLEVLASAPATVHDEVADQLADQAGTARLRTVLAAAARHRRAMAVPGAWPGARPVVVAPVSVGQEVTGYLLTLDEGDLGLTEDMRLLAIEHAAMVCGIVLGYDLVVSAAAGQARQQLVEALLLSRDRDETEAERWARHLGLVRDREHYVIAIAAPGARTSPIEARLARHAPGSVVVGRADEVVAIVPVSADDGPAAEQGRAIARAICAGGERLPVAGTGIGTPCATAVGIARSYAEARRALAAGQRLASGVAITAFADLGIHRLLMRVPDVADLQSFAGEVLLGLAEEERASGVDYLATLSAYFRENGSPRRAAQRLHVHPNTVSYRIRRVEEITGLSLDLHRDRLMAEVAAEILYGPGREP